MNAFFGRTRKLVFFKFFSLVRKLNLAKLKKIKKDNREVTPYKLVFFCGKSGIEFLNASLFSVYKNWKQIPEVIIISDGTPEEIIKKKLIHWPQKLEIFSWQHCAQYFKDKGTGELYEYGSKNIWGKKFVGICYCADQFPILYSDTDIIWYNSPLIEVKSGEVKVKMCQDVEYCYSEPLLKSLNVTGILKNVPLNAGLIYTSGKYSLYPHWKEMITYLASYPDHRTEQTSFAVLNNYFNEADYFKQEEIFIKIDDMFGLKYTKVDHPEIWARHYVNLKDSSFWRDFLYLYFGLKK